jgi:hypothetical protein
MSCRKSTKKYVDGYVLDNSTGKVLEGVRVELQYWTTGGSYNYESVCTDASGHFSFSRKRKFNYQYALRTFADDYTVYYTNIGNSRSPFMLSPSPLGYLKLHVIKTGTKENTLKISYVGHTFYLSKKIPFDSIFNKEIKEKAAWKLPIQWETVGSFPTPVTLIGKDTIVLETGKTTLYKIEYE